MPVQEIFGSTIALLGKTLDLRTKRQGLISANLANVETPGYKATDLSFDKELRSVLEKGNSAQLKKTNPRHIPLKGGAAGLAQVQGVVVEVSGQNLGPDGNGVELESEMGRMAENQIMYNASVQLLNKKFEMMKQAIKGTL